jgi:hypothetical protein
LAKKSIAQSSVAGDYTVMPAAPVDQVQNRLSADYADYANLSRFAGENQGQKHCIAPRRKGAKKTDTWCCSAAKK